MSQSGPARIVWKCPECARVFRIPRSKPRPDRCMKCAGATPVVSKVTHDGSDDEGEIRFQEAPPAKPSSLNFDVSVERPAENAASPPAGSSVTVEQLSDRLDEVLEHLEGITRTMRLVRWVMWGLGAATVLSIVVTLAGLMYSMSLVGSLTGILNPSGEAGPQQDLAIEQIPAGDPRIPPQLRKDMQKIEEYSRTMDELLQEVNQ